MSKRIYYWLHTKVRGHYQARYHGKYKYPKHIFAFDAFLMTAVVALAGFILYFNILWVPGIARQINLEIISSSEIRVGEETKFKIRYGNRSKETIYSVTLGLEAPRGFIVESSSPDLGQHNTLYLGTIHPGGNEKIVVSGRALGALGERQELIVYLTFERNGGREQKVVSRALTLSGQAVETAVGFPKVITAGEEVSLPVELENMAKLKGAAVKMTLAGDKNFIVTGESEIFQGDFTGKKTVVFRGFASGQAKEVKLNLRSAITYQNEDFLNGESVFTVNVLPAEVQVSLASSAGVASVASAQELPFYFKAVNRSGKDIKNARVEIIDRKNMLDREFGTAGAVWDGNKLVFSAKKNIAKDGAWEFSFKARTKDAYSAAAGMLQKNLNLEMLPSVVFAADKKVFYGNILDLKFKSALQLKTFARYFGPEGDPLGRGPLPPEAGKETRLWIFMNVGNTFNNIAGVNFTARLANGVEFTGATTVFYGDKIEYNMESREVKWPLGLVAAYAGAGAEMPAAGFEVKFTPSESDRGKTVTLLDASSVSGNDEYTGETVRVSLPPLKTTFEFDEEAAGKGIVR